METGSLRSTAATGTPHTLSSRSARTTTTIERLVRDPRHFQIAILGSFLFYGLFVLDFDLSLVAMAVTLTTALATQALCSRVFGKHFDFRSPLISGFSLCLLLRTAAPWVAAVGAAAAISSKFLIRWKGKHVFNPANFGIGFAVLVTAQAWSSPGQWGSGFNSALLFVCLGGLVVHRALRSDVSYAFLAGYAAILFGRAAWLGDPLAIPLRALDSGALLLFAFFMISDPKTTPDARPGRIVYGILVAAVSGWIHFVLFRPNGFLWALLCCAPLVPLIDRVFVGLRYRWPGAASTSKEDRPMTAYNPIASRPPRARWVTTMTLALVAALLAGARAEGFCGFYVSKADTKLFNQASQVVLVRDGDRTVITMANDYRGTPEEFAMVIPVPTLLERGQIHVADQALIDHLDAYTAPRLVEYHDPDPCAERKLRAFASMARQMPASADAMLEEEARRDGVTIEAKYTVGEYDILILSAEQSDGLAHWLHRNGYKIPNGAERVLDSYLRQGMRFFVAKVNLDQQAELGFANLRPLQIAFEHPRFMLPIRLGTVNADGEQELFVYTLTRQGRVETTNYRTVKLPSDIELPTFVETKFADFYRDMFERQVAESRRRGVFLEYAWDMAWCDPCAADPLSADELRRLGVFWVDADVQGPARDVFVTRLHVRYSGETFPEDLMFHQTADRSNFQGRYVMRHPWRGTATCRAADDYRVQVAQRMEREAQALARLTGWRLEEIRGQMDFPETGSEEPRRWWERIWPGR